MNTKTFLLAVLTVFFTCSIAFAQVEEITLSTYYPAPYGDYDELAAEKLFVDKQIIGNMDVDGDGIDSTPADMDAMNVGSLLIENDVGIGTNNPAGAHKLLIDGGVRIINGNLAIGPNVFSNQPYLSLGESFLKTKGSDRSNIIRVSSGGAKYTLFTSGSSEVMALTDAGNVGIGTTSPQAKLHVGGTAGTDGIMFPDGTLQTTAVGGIASATMYDGSVSLMEVYDGDFNPAVQYTIDVSNYPEISNDTKALLIHINIRSEGGNQANLGYKKPSHSNWKYLLGSPDHADQTGGDNVDECNITHGKNVVNWFQLENGRIQFRIWSQGGPDLIIDAQGEITN